MLQATFLNRQALHLRPDPARVIVRPFKPATEPRDLNPTDKTRANHIVDRVLALDPKLLPASSPMCWRISRAGIATCWRRSVARRRNGTGAGGAQQLFQRPAPADRRLFSSRIFVRSLALFNPSIIAAPRPIGRAEGGLRFILSLRATGEGMCRH